LSPRADACLRRLLSVEGPASEAVDQLAAIADDFQLVRGAELVRRFRERLECLEALGTPAARLFVKSRLRRTLQYYTGFMFELHAPCLRGASEVCGGGRYDHLLRSLGAPQDVPAIGFAIGVDRVYLALAKPSTAEFQSVASQSVASQSVESESVGATTPSVLPAPNSIDAVLTPAGQVSMGDCFRVAAIARAAGWSVEVELDGRRPKSAIAKAARHDVPYMIIVGADEQTRGGVNVKELSSHAEHFVTLGDLPAFIAARRMAKAAAKRDGGDS
jgi:histidyl-tRNA synthetase